MTSPTADVFEAVWVRRAAPATAGVARLTWRAPDQGARLAQVYVNRRLYAVSASPEVRAMWLHLEPGPPEPLIELVAVAPAERWTDYAGWLAGRRPELQPNAELTLARDEALPLGGRVHVSVDGEPAGEAAMWGPGDSRAGFGAAFGIGSFGRDDATGPGLGRAAFGVGPFGRDGSGWRWGRDDLPDGEHAIDAVVTDRSGRTVAALDAPILRLVARPPRPVDDLRVEPGPTGLRLGWAE